jgi:hypothetical protein
MGTFLRIIETICGTGLGGYLLILMHEIIRNRREERQDHTSLRQAIVGTSATEYEDAKPGLIEIVTTLSTTVERLCSQVTIIDGRLAWLEDERKGDGPA